ncbi:TIGR03089 family protein [Nocardioides zeae]
MTASTHRPAVFADLLAGLVAAEPGRPLVTWYAHDAAGAVTERVELSVVTYANWVAKTAGLLTDALDLERGDTLLVDLPTHWLAPVAWGAAWSAGLVVAQPADPAAADAEAVLCGPATLDRWAGEADGRVVVAAALTPLARPFAGGVPGGVHDLGVEVWGQPDGYVALDAPAADDAALGDVSHAELLAGAATAPSASRVLLSGLAERAALRRAVDVVAAGGSVVLVDDDAPLAPWWDERRAVIERDERISPAR